MEIEISLIVHGKKGNQYQPNFVCHSHFFHLLEKKHQFIFLSFLNFCLSTNWIQGIWCFWPLVIEVLDDGIQGSSTSFFHLPHFSFGHSFCFFNSTTKRGRAWSFASMEVQPSKQVSSSPSFMETTPTSKSKSLQLGRHHLQQCSNCQSYHS